MWLLLLPVMLRVFDSGRSRRLSAVGYDVVAVERSGRRVPSFVVAVTVAVAARLLVVLVTALLALLLLLLLPLLWSGRRFLILLRDGQPASIK